MKEIIKINIDKLIKVLLVTKKETQQINKIANILITAIKKGKKIFVYGNGGSFADSSHFVGELTATYKKKRRPLPFFLLGSNMASVSAWANDYKNDQYISRELTGYANKGDILIILSTSGGNFKQKQSMNLIQLSKIAKQNKIFLISLLGKGGGVLKRSSDICYIVKSDTTGTIQEVQKMLLHSICDLIENKI
tara:strand:- start:1104 stop:1682 length:579 start_codon:yes stop_codon:yes gene_type:complete